MHAYGLSCILMIALIQKTKTRHIWRSSWMEFLSGLYRDFSTRRRWLWGEFGQGSWAKRSYRWHSWGYFDNSCIQHHWWCSTLHSWHWGASRGSCADQSISWMALLSVEQLSIQSSKFLYPWGTSWWDGCWNDWMKLWSGNFICIFSMLYLSRDFSVRKVDRWMFHRLIEKCQS